MAKAHQGDHGHSYRPCDGQGQDSECQILEALGVDYIDESEVLTPTDDKHHVVKHGFSLLFVGAGTWVRL